MRRCHRDNEWYVEAVDVLLAAMIVLNVVLGLAFVLTGNNSGLVNLFLALVLSAAFSMRRRESTGHARWQ